MRDSGSSVLESRREGSGVVLVLMGFRVKEGFREEGGLQRGRRDEKGLRYPRQNMLVYGRGRP